MSTPVPSGGADPARPSRSEVAAQDIAPRRTHPVTPLVSGWKVLAGIFAVVSIQNLPRLVDDFTVGRLLWALGVLAAVILVSVLASAIAWWRTTYQITAEGVTVRSGLLSLNQRFAPREKIDSVSVERPLLARLLGLSKVRVEIAGGAESHVDIEYVADRDANRIRSVILTLVGDPDVDGDADAAHGTAEASLGADPSSTRTLETEQEPGSGAGTLIARIPTRRLLASMVRDGSHIAGAVLSVVSVAVFITFTIRTDGFSVAGLIALIPAVIAGPRTVLASLERGWGFTSRDTDKGLRLQRGLLNTRTDSISAGRVQKLELTRPWLWRTPGWTRAEAAVAGIEAAIDESTATHILPVGTHEELARTLEHVVPPLGTEDDLAEIEQDLTAPARGLDGLRAPDGMWTWIDHRTQAVRVLPHAVILRTGILGRGLQVVPRDRIQGVQILEGPVLRRLGLANLRIHVAGDSVLLEALPRERASALGRELARNAATERRYTDRARWRMPRGLLPSAQPLTGVPGPRAAETPRQPAAGPWLPQEPR